MFDLFSAATGGTVGATLVWFLNQAVKRHGEQVSNRRKTLASNLDTLSKMVESLQKSALLYYGRPNSEGVELSRQIKVDLRSFAREWNSLNKRLPEVGKKKLLDSDLVKFRQSLTLSMDDSSRKLALTVDDPIILEVLDCADNLQELFSRIKFELS